MFRFLGLICCASALMSGESQTVATGSTATVVVTSSSESKALATVEAAITSMGGRGPWLRVGGATAQAVVSAVGKGGRAASWNDDWSRGRVRFRRDEVGDGTNNYIVGTDAQQVHQKLNGQSDNLQHDNGIVALALGYPAPALILSLGRYGCSFKSGKPADPRLPIKEEADHDLVVTEQCPDPFYPAGKATLIWTFSSSSHLPESVELPVWSQLHRTIRPQTAQFLTFQNIGNLWLPSLLAVRRVSGTTETISLTNTVLSSGLPDSKFYSAH